MEKFPDGILRNLYVQERIHQIRSWIYMFFIFFIFYYYDDYDVISKVPTWLCLTPCSLSSA